MIGAALENSPHVIKKNSLFVPRMQKKKEGKKRRAGQAGGKKRLAGHAGGKKRRAGHAGGETRTPSLADYFSTPSY